jgi:general stress protein 26
MAGRHHKLLEMIGHFDDAMLVTRRDHELRSRPMALAEVTPDAHLWFITSSDSAKSEELEADPHVNVAFQDGKRFVSVSGDARLVSDKAHLESLWRDEHRLWFEGGLHDRRAVLLEVTPKYAEYWDRSGTDGLRFALEEFKAAMADETLSDDAGTHDKIPHPERTSERGAGR